MQSPTEIGVSAWRQLLSVGTAALIVGLDSIGFSVALASLMFTGALASGLAMGITAALACSIVMALVIGGFSALRSNIASAQDIGSAVLAVTLASAVTGLAAEARVPTAFAIIGASTLATGVLLFAVGAFRVARLVRYFPLEVLAGFMAATGFLLLMGGIAMVAQVPANIHGMLEVTSVRQLTLLLPAVALAALIYFAMERYRKPALLLTILITATALFHLVRQASGLSMADAAVAGWLPVVPPVSGVALPFPALLPLIDWASVLAAAPTIATVAALSLFAALMNTSALEFASGQEMDLDREMRLAGGANVIAAGTGGPPGYTLLAFTLLMQKFGISSRAVGLLVAAIELAGLLYAATVAMTVPTFVAAGLILYYGFDMVKDWLVSTRKTYSPREWGVVVVIVLIAILYSFLVAIFAGLLIATMLFAYSYANSPVVRHTTDLARLPSTTERAPADAQRLAELGHTVRVFRLQGFLFFGTTEQVMAQIRSASKEAGGLKAVIVDFSRVTEMDSASANTFKRAIALARADEVRFILSGLDERLAETLRRVGVEPGNGGSVSFATELDLALAEAEALLLGEAQGSGAVVLLSERYSSSTVTAAQAAQLFAEMRRQVHEAGSPIIKAGSKADEVLFVESGRAVVQMVGANGKVRRLRTMLAGAIIGDVAYSMGGLRTADVIAETKTVTLSISQKQVASLAKTKPALAQLFDSLLRRALAEKVVMANRMTDLAG